MSRRAKSFVWLCMVLLVWPAAAQPKRPMTLVDMLEIPSLSDPRLSPDGRQLLYVLAETDWQANKQIAHIWRINVDGTDARQLTHGKSGESSPRWGPDGSRIAFLAKRGEDQERQIYLLSNLGGEAQRLTNHPTAVSNIQWAPDGSAVYFLARDPKTEEEKAREKAKDDVFAFDENDKQRHLWKVMLADKSEHRLTEGDYSILGYTLSRDGTRIAFHRAPTPLFDDSDEGEVWVMNADGSAALQLTHNRVPERGAVLSPDNRTVLFTTGSNAAFEPYYNNNLFIIPATGGQVRLLMAEWPHEIGSAAWSADGRRIYFTANTGVRVNLFQVDVASEKLTRLTEGDHSLRFWSYRPALKRHVFAIDSPANAGDVWLLPEGKASRPQQITHVFDYLAARFLLPRQEAIQWAGADGVTVEGILVYPLDYREGQRYPLVVKTHGGPASSDKFGFGRWSTYQPVLAAMGYAILNPNYRGSTGYGDAFLRDMVGHYFNQAHLDVMAGVDYLIERGLADGDHMVKMGWSAGGHMTNKIITYTDRFKAASSGAGAVNWISMYGQSDVRIYRTPWFGGTPWQKDAPIDVYWQNSPLSDIWKVKTPTLILVGEKDVRVPPPQSVELYRALKSNGVPTHLYIAPREPHGWRELRHRLFKMNVELEWFEKYARGRTYTWEKPPTEKARAEKEGISD